MDNESLIVGVIMLVAIVAIVAVVWRERYTGFLMSLKSTPERSMPHYGSGRFAGETAYSSIPTAAIAMM